MRLPDNAAEQGQLQPADSKGFDTAVETDPNHRYLRYPVLLGRGACKRVYKAFDQEEGIEVAWNQVELMGTDLDPEGRERLFGEIRVLRTLKHRNIMSFYDWWFDAKAQTINFITEYFTSGALRQYRKKHKLISDNAIKRWAFQILEGLLYLHAHDPPIVHRDLKCDNILVNGTSGQVKIADLGLASCQRGLSVVGTPEFMAPEVYDEVYDEKVDIYSFGMCMLELATLEYPYSECRSIPAIFRKVSQGIPPAGLAKVSNPSLRDFITTCINPNPTNRPGALQLLKHPFFDCLRVRTESAGGSPTHGMSFSPLFGSCGNLLALACAGSHHSSQSRPVKTVPAAAATQPAASIAVAQQAAPQLLQKRAQQVGWVADLARKEPSMDSSQLESSVSSADGMVVIQAGGEALSMKGISPLSSNSSGSSTNQPQAQQQQQQHQKQQQLEQQGGATRDAAVGNGVVTHAPGADIGSVGARRLHVVIPPSRHPWQQARQQQQQHPLSPGQARLVGEFTRGTTICVAAIPKTGLEQVGEDSDDEVLVPLEDVLTPHPEDLLDPETHHLNSHITHTGDGSIIVSGPGCLLDSCLSGFGGFSDLSENSAAAGFLTGMTSLASPAELPGETSVPTLQQRQQSAATAGAAVGAANSVPSGDLLKSPNTGADNNTPCRTGSFSLQRAASRAQQQQHHHSGMVAPTQHGVPSIKGTWSEAGSNSILRSAHLSLVGYLDQHQQQAEHALQLAQLQHAATAAAALEDRSLSAPLPRHRSEAVISHHVRTGSGSSVLGSIESAEAVRARLLRTISNTVGSAASGSGSSNRRTAAGALAAAGLLQMSPGLYMPTPPLLGKLLIRNNSKSGRDTADTRNHASGLDVHAQHRRTKTSESIGDYWSSQQQLAVMPSAVAIAASQLAGQQQQQQHWRLRIQPSKPSPAASRPPSAPSRHGSTTPDIPGVVDSQAAEEASMGTATSSPSKFAAAATSTGRQDEATAAELNAGTKYISYVGCVGESRGLFSEAGAHLVQQRSLAGSRCVTPPWLMQHCSIDNTIADAAAPFAASPAGNGPAAATAASHGAAAGGSSAGRLAFGRIVVRRRFAKNLPLSNGLRTLKRSNTL